MRYLAGILLLLSVHALAGPQLYVFDCGGTRMPNLDMFNIKPEESSVRELFVPCYVIKHEKGVLLWDAGLPKAIADAGAPLSDAASGTTTFYKRYIIDQLKDIGLAPEDIDYVSYSHLHFDHSGAANDLAATTVILQKAEWDSAFSPEPVYVNPALLTNLKSAKLKLIEGDYDVFGDGTVRMISSPGHTPGHQSLLLMLDNTGPIMLSGDVYHTRANRRLRRVPTFNYNAEQTLQSMDKIEQLLVDTRATLWIEHDKELADTLKKAPAYYD